MKYIIYTAWLELLFGIASICGGVLQGSMLLFISGGVFVIMTFIAAVFAASEGISVNPFQGIYWKYLEEMRKVV